jgi:molecular chaperone HscB
MRRRVAAAEAHSRHSSRSTQFERTLSRRERVADSLSAGGRVKDFSSSMNYFEVFGLPKRLNLDLNALEKTFHELSRKYHPDFFTTAPVEERQRALQMTAALNDAYRALRHPVRRVEHLVEVEGFKPDGSKVPKSFLMEVFEINEQLEEVKAGSASKEQIAALRKEIEGRAAGFESQLQSASMEWDKLDASGASDADRKQQLVRLTEILSESSYIRNLQRELEGTS